MSSEKMSGKNRDWESLIIFVFTLAVSLAAAYVLVFQFNFIQGDAFARAANAYYVLYSRYPHFGAIGFVWTPLPSLMDLPLLLFKDIFPPLAAKGFAANVVSSLFAAGSLVILNRIFLIYKLGRIARYSFLLIYLLNPVILFFSANGMTEIILVFFILLSTYHFIKWSQTEKVSNLMWTGIALSLAFLARYEAMVVAIAMVLAILLKLWRTSSVRQRTLAISLTFAAPVIYTVGVWVFLNWLIVKNPIYFIQSQYAPFAQTEVVGQKMQLAIAATHSILGTLQFGGWIVLNLFPLYFVLLAALAVVAISKLDRTSMALIIISLSIVSFQAYRTYTGETQWTRFYIYIIPFSFLFIPPILTFLKKRKAIAAAGLVIGLILSSVVSGMSMLNQDLAIEQYDLYLYLKGSPRTSVWEYNAQTADYLDAKNLGEGKVLVDTFTGFSIVLASSHPKTFVITSDPDFKHLLQSPDKIAYILVPRPDGPMQIAQLDAVNQTYPNLYYRGAEFATLETEFKGPYQWRLYRVTKPTGGL